MRSIRARAGSGLRAPRLRLRRPPRSCAVSLKRGVRVLQVGQVRRAWAGVEVAEERVVTWPGLEIAYDLAWVVEVAEHDGAGRAGVLAGGRDRAGRHGAVVAFGRAAGAADALDAVGA